MENYRTFFFQFIKFGAVGFLNTAISYITYIVALKFGAHYLAASFLGFFLSVINAFYWNNRYVFKNTKSDKWKMFMKTLSSYAGTGLLLNNILLVVLVDIFHVAAWLAPLVTLIITIPLNFLLNKFWAFK